MRKRIAQFFCREIIDAAYERDLQAKDEIHSLRKRIGVFETQKATILKAAIDASERVAFIVSQRGDQNLKDYVDDCFHALISAHGVN